MIDRRTFMTSLAIAGLGLAGTSAAALADANAMRRRSLNFKIGLRERPWLLGWDAMDAPTCAAGPDEIQVEGRIPASLDGDFMRNGPGGHVVFGHRYRHWFDGDGLVHRFRLKDGEVRHDGRIIDTPKWRAEQAAVKPLFDAFDTDVDGSGIQQKPDAMNTGNINIIRHAGRLLALWEGGSAIELDPVTLGFRSFLALSPKTSGLPFSAHPRLDSDGSLWSFGYAGYLGKILLYRIRPDGRLHTAHLIDAPDTPMLHDFMITDRHIVFILTPWRYDRSVSGTFLEHHRWQPEKGGQALIIDKNDLARQQTVDLPPFWTFHFGNAWEDGSGVIRFDYCRYVDPSATTEGFRQVMNGEAPTGSSASYDQARIDTVAGTFSGAALIDGPAVEFPRVHPARMGQRTDHAVMLLADPDAGAAHPYFTTTAMVNQDSGRVDAFVHDAREIAEEAVFVPATAGNDGTGWVLQTVLDFGVSRTRLKIFDASDLASGPVAVATLPYALPLGLHGSFMKG
ncbi:MAG: carotenoid oxygenase family protein [Minwuia sp.]|nr:carotenoid oxygenase family protein [Minwuia sp.]